MSNDKRIRLHSQSAQASGLSRRDVMQILAGTIGAGVAIPGFAEGHPMQSHLANHATIAQADAKATAADGGGRSLPRSPWKMAQPMPTSAKAVATLENSARRSRPWGVSEYPKRKTATTNIVNAAAR